MDIDSSRRRAALRQLVAARLAIGAACTPAVLHAQEADAEASASSDEPVTETVIVTVVASAPGGTWTVTPSKRTVPPDGPIEPVASLLEEQAAVRRSKARSGATRSIS